MGVGQACATHTDELSGYTPGEYRGDIEHDAGRADFIADPSHLLPTSRARWGEADRERTRDGATEINYNSGSRRSHSLFHVDPLESYRGKAMPAWMVAEQLECMAI